jgi:hypothetical protein
MCFRSLLRSLSAAGALALSTGTVHAAPEVLDAVRSHLYAGRSAEAIAAAEAGLAEAPGDDENRYALGAAEFVRAVERLGQGLHRYGLRGADEDSFAAMAGLPILRIPVPHNPSPDRISYEAMNELLATFASDLAAAEATLAGIQAESLDLPIDVGAIRLDLDGDGTGTEDEALWRMLKRVAALSWLDEQSAAALDIDFDASDVPWLRAYCHVLMAISEFPLAYDWRAAFEATFHGLFPEADLPSGALNAKSAPGGDYAHYAGIFDLVAFVHLNHWPVVAPERLKNVLVHLEAVPPLSRENWRRILAETDDANEWLPGPRQSGALGIAVTQEQIDGWMLFLDEFDALLHGRKLLPHWRFTQGINLRRMFLEPTTLDIVLLIQGFGALPYLEDGELTTGNTWRRITRIFGGDFFRYALWFN